MPSRSRRALLKTVGIVATGLAGCQTNRDDHPTKPSTHTETTTRRSANRSSPITGRSDTDWPLAQHGATHTSYIREGATLHAEPSERWSVPSSVPPDIDALGATFSQPVVIDKHLYLVNRVEVGTERPDPGGHTLQARDSTTGELQWTFSLPRRPPSPAVSGRNALIPSGDTLYALDRFDGSIRWTRNLDGYGRVVPAADRIYVWGEKLHALSPEGETVWKRSFDESFAVPPAIDTGNVYAALVGGGVVALDTGTGETSWTEETPRGGAETEALSPNVSTVVATEGEVFIVTDGDIHAFDKEGEVRWHREGHVWKLTTDGTALYHRDRTPDPYRTVLRARDVQTGEITWEKPLEVNSLAHGVLTDEALYMPTGDALIAVSPDNGRKLWSSTTAIDSLALAEGMLFGNGPDDVSLISMS